MRSFWDETMQEFTAFPDFAFTFSSIEERVVVIRDYIGGGHHTGVMECPPHPHVVRGVLGTTGATNE